MEEWIVNLQLMSRTATICWLSALLLVAAHPAQAPGENRPKAWTDPNVARQEDPDFAIQGEYGSASAGAGLGVQVIALGKGQFDAYLLQGGLPGLGWTPGIPRTLLKGVREGDRATFTSADKKTSATILGGNFLMTGADGKNSTLPRIERTSSTLGAKPPKGAWVLFDGGSAEQWENGKSEKGCLLATGCTSKQRFGDYRLHLEFRTPYQPTARGQQRGNSGVYHSGRWETQILDSFGLDGNDNECGGIYSISKPRLNMCLPPLAWQTYDVEFTAAQFDASGKRTAWPRITVRLNGVLVHEDLELAKDFTTSAPISIPLDGPEGPVFLQDHGNPVVFRNIWIVPGKSAKSSNQDSKPPNFILILADDLGYGDLGVTGSKQIPTPHIDSLAAAGVRFTNAYVSSSVCAPSRAGLMTGKHQASFGFRDNLAPVQPGHDPEFVGLPLNQTTLPQRLKSLGYTTGLVGKWHLGELPKFSPLQRGFDEFWGYLGGAHDYFRAEPGGEKSMAGPILCNYKEPGPLTYLTDDQGAECVDFICRHKGQPFFLFASFAAPHAPMQATQEDLNRFAHIEDRLRRTYCAMVYRLDQNVGRILNEVRAQGIERDTFVVFLSDNGGPCAPGISNGSVNAPFRGSKTTVLEGGIRVPMFFKWSATLSSGMTTDMMVSSLDILPTFVVAAGGSIQPSERITGVDLLPFLTGKREKPPHESLMWTYTVGSAIRTGDWKLVRLPDRLPMLYHLSADTGERDDLALEHSDQTRSMLKELGRWEVNSPNPVFREPSDWRIRHLGFYDSDYQMHQPDELIVYSMEFH